MAAATAIESRCIRVYSKFLTSRLDDSWVEPIWESDFTIIDGFPLDFESLHDETNWICLFRDAVTVCRDWIQTLSTKDNNFHESDRGFWTIFVENDISIKKIIALSFYFSDKGQKLSSNKTEKETALWASDLYLSLLSVPGCNAFSVFHPLMFQKCIDICKMAIQVHGISLKRKRGKEKRNSKHAAKKKKKKGINVEEFEEDRLSEIFDDESDMDEDCAMDSQEIKTFTSDFEKVLHHMIDSLKIFSLKQCEQSILHAIQRLADLTRIETDVSSPRNSPSSLRKLGYEGLKAMCLPLHGKIDKAHTQVMKQMMTNISEKNKIKDEALQFILHLLELLGKDAQLGTKILIQRLCVEVHDRAEHRASVGNSVAIIVDKLDEKSTEEIFVWFDRLLLNSRVNCRLFTIELLAMFLEEGGIRRRTHSSVSQVNSKQKKLLMMIVSRFCDKASSVRAKVLQILSHCAVSSNDGLRNCFLELFEELDHREDSDKENERVEDDNDESVNYETDFMSILRTRFDDDKVHVRKAALQVLENVIKLNSKFLCKENLMDLQQRCLDPALLVRKQVITSITNLLECFPENCLLHNVWVEGVLPNMVDRETSVQEKCMEVMENVILQNIVTFERSFEERHKMVWKILNLIAEKGSERFLRRACNLWAKNGKIRPNLIPILQTHISTENGSAVWLLLSEIAPNVAIKNISLVANYWFNRTEESSVKDLHRILLIIGHCTKYLTREEAVQLRSELESILIQFSYPTILVCAALTTLNRILRHLSHSEVEAKKLITSFSIGLLKKCDEFLSDAILQQKNVPLHPDTEDKMICYLFTVGEVAINCPSKVPKRIFLVVQSLITTPIITSHDSAAYDLPSSQSQNDQMSQPQSQSVKQFSGSDMPQRVRAHAFVTLGKLCLQNEQLAKKCAPALARELEMSTEATIRNNIVIIMADLCVRYTALVDRYMSNISSCLKDPSVIVRRQTLMLLTSLLQEDYIKWKGPLFVRFISSLADDDEKIRSLAEYSLIHILLHRYPHMFYNHFVECIFHFHAYKEHAAFNSVPQTEKEVELFALKGHGNNEEKRLKMYRFMLDNMTDEHRFQITAKIVQDILGGIVDGILPLNEHSQDIVRDGLKILACDEIKLSTLRASPQDDLDEGDLLAVVVVTAKKTIVSQVVKKNVIENIVPIIISLKHKLEEKKSILLKDLMFFLKELMKDYKNEIKDILSADKGLAKEIEFDLRRFETEQQQEDKANKRKANRRNASVNNEDGCQDAVIVNNINNNCSKNTPFSPLAVLASVKGLIDRRTVEKSITSSNRDAEKTFVENDVNDEGIRNPDVVMKSPVVSLKRLSSSLSPEKVIKVVNDEPLPMEENENVNENENSSKNEPKPNTDVATTSEVIPHLSHDIVTVEQLPQQLPEPRNIVTTPLKQSSPRLMNKTPVRIPVISLERLSAEMSTPVVDLSALSLNDKNMAPSTPVVNKNLKRINLLRAISTPDKSVAEVTFRFNENSMTLPSPIVALERLPNGVLRRLEKE